MVYNIPALKRRKPEIASNESWISIKLMNEETFTATSKALL
jgi:hypothetical protein